MSNTSTSIPISSYSSLTWSNYLRMIFASIGVFTNVVSILVFVSPKLKDNTYRYMLASSVVNLIFLTIHFGMVLFSTCSNCPSSQTYSSALAAIILAFYTQNCLAVLRALLDITISVRIFNLLRAKKTKTRSNSNSDAPKSYIDRISYSGILIGLTSISFVFYIQQPFAYWIRTTTRSDGSVIFSAKSNNFGNSSFCKWLIVAQFSVRIVLTLIILPIINVLSINAFRKKFKKPVIFNNNQNNAIEPSISMEKNETFMIQVKRKQTEKKKRKQGTSEKKSTINLTRMVVFSAFLNIIGLVPYSIIYILNRVVYTGNQVAVATDVSLVVMYMTIDLDFLIYYVFNKPFRKALKGYFNKSEQQQQQ